MRTCNDKYRHEYKFIINEKQSILLQDKLSCIMSMDRNVNEYGMYRIRSAYFDDYNDTCLRQNESGIVPRGKWRIRIYNQSDKRISLEHKIKNRDMTLKETSVISREMCETFLRGEAIEDDLFANQKTLNSFNLIMQKKIFTPKVIVDYLRIPFVETCGNVRITFDKCLISSTSFEEFFSPTMAARPVMPCGLQVLEVKYDEYLPEYIKNALEVGILRQTAYSKYYLCRKFNL